MSNYGEHNKQRDNYNRSKTLLELIFCKIVIKFGYKSLHMINCLYYDPLLVRLSPFYNGKENSLKLVSPPHYVHLSIIIYRN